jgi:predicted ester cyclase
MGGEYRNPHEQHEDPMERARFEDVARRWATEAVGQGRVEVFDALLAADAIDRSGPIAAIGSETFKARARGVHAAFTDVEVVVDALLVEGDTMAWRWTLTGVHSGPLHGIAATGRRVTLKGMNVQRLVDGKVVEHWSIADQLGLVSALQ